MVVVMVVVVMVVVVMVVVVMVVMVEEARLAGAGVAGRHGVVVAGGARCLRLAGAEGRVRGADRRVGGGGRGGRGGDGGGGGRAARADWAGGRGGRGEAGAAAGGRVQRRRQTAYQGRRPRGRGAVLQLRRGAGGRASGQHRRPSALQGCRDVAGGQIRSVRAVPADGQPCRVAGCLAGCRGGRRHRRQLQLYQHHVVP